MFCDMENDIPTRSRPKTPLDHEPAKLRRCRFEAGFSLGRLAGAVGCSPGHLSELENGSRNPSPELLLRLSRALDCKPKDLMPDLPQRLSA